MTIRSRPPAIMLPQLGVGGCTPRPRKDSPLSSRIALPTPRVAATTAGPSAFGSTWRQSRRGDGTPSAVAASTYGRARTPSTSPRTSRATPIQPVATRITTTVFSPGVHNAATSSSRISRGIASSASATAIRAASSGAAAPRCQRADHHARECCEQRARPRRPAARCGRRASCARTNRGRTGRCRAGARDPPRRARTVEAAWKRARRPPPGGQPARAAARAPPPVRAATRSRAPTARKSRHRRRGSSRGSSRSAVRLAPITTAA